MKNNLKQNMIKKVIVCVVLLFALIIGGEVRAESRPLIVTVPLDQIPFRPAPTISPQQPLVPLIFNSINLSPVGPTFAPPAQNQILYLLRLLQMRLEQ